MKSNTKKIIGAVVCGACVILLWAIYIAIFLFAASVSPFFKGIIAAVCLAFSIVMVALIIERIKEIRSGVEDDLSKY